MKQSLGFTRPIRAGGAHVQDGAARQRRLRWRRWRLPEIDQPERLTSAELSECTCPDLCQRDHDHD